jgi:hypothetical protein
MAVRDEHFGSVRLLAACQRRIVVKYSGFFSKPKEICLGTYPET